jgi:hypothetical protein
LNSRALAITNSLTQNAQTLSLDEIKDRLREVVNIIYSTLDHARQIFYNGAELSESGMKRESPLLLSLLQPIITSDDFGVKSDIKSIKSPALEDIQDACQQWVQKCAQDGIINGSKLLQQVTKAKDLKSVQEIVWTAVCEGPKTHKMVRSSSSQSNLSQLSEDRSPFDSPVPIKKTSSKIEVTTLDEFSPWAEV